MRDNLADKQRLRHCVATSVRTTMIGALAAFEDEFGYLWGIGLDYDELSADQKKFRERWMNARERVLQIGENADKISRRAVNSHCVQKKAFHQEFED